MIRKCSENNTNSVVNSANQPQGQSAGARASTTAEQPPSINAQGNVPPSGSNQFGEPHASESIANLILQNPSMN